MSKWVVDTCVIIDVLSGDSAFSTKSADAMPDDLQSCFVSVMNLKS